jgi:hypothetical protein
MNARTVNFFSEGTKMEGDLFLPALRNLRWEMARRIVAPRLRMVRTFPEIGTLI